MTKTTMTFGEWLFKEIDKRGWSQAKLAREAKVSRAAISNILSGNRDPGPELATKIAHALKLPPEHVFTVAGILKQKNARRDPRIDEIMHRAEQLDDHDRNALLEFIEMLDRMRGKRNSRK